MNRSVKDIRHPGCKDMKYIEKLPSVAVIFPFHDEVCLRIKHMTNYVFPISSCVVFVIDVSF